MGDCKWPDENSLTLTFVRYTKDESVTANNKVGKLDVREQGPIDHQITDPQINTAKANLAVALRDQREPEQADLAAFLAAISPSESKQPEQVRNDAPPVDFDWSGIRLSLLALVGTCASIAGIMRGKKIYDSHKTKQATVLDIFQAIDGLLQVKDGEVGSVYTSGNPLDIDWGDSPLTARDDPGLDSMLKEKADLDVIVVELRALRDGLEALAKPWSGATLEKIGETSRNAASLLIQVPKQTEQYLNARAAAIKDIRFAPDTAKKLTDTLANFEAQIDKLEQAGWDVSSLRTSLGTYSEANGGVAVSMSKQHFISASEQAKNILTNLEAEFFQATNAEETFASNATRHETRSKVVDQYIEKSASDRATLTSLQERFDTSCTERIGTLQHEVQIFTNDLERMQAELMVVVAEKSFKALDETAQKTDGFTSTQVALERKRGEVADTIAHLEMLAEQLPGDITSSEQAYVADRDTVHSWGHDVDDDVLAELKDIKQDFAKLQTGLQDKRPAYFDIESSFDKISAQSERLLQTARKQHAEAEELRSDITSGNANARKELEELHRYVRDNNDASHVSANIDLKTFSVSGSRKDLQKELEEQSKLRASIAHKLKEAEAAVRKAEAEREAERLAVIAAAEAERRREQKEQRRPEEASRPSHTTGDIGGGSSPSHNTSDL